MAVSEGVSRAKFVGKIFIVIGVFFALVPLLALRFSGGEMLGFVPLLGLLGSASQFLIVCGTICWVGGWIWEGFAK